MQEKTDKELYKEFLLGNNESFEEIVKRHKNSIIYFIQRYTKSIDIAEDLAQDVFLYVLIHKKNYRFEYSLKTYLYTIAKSKALNYIKREKRIVAIDEKEYENIKDVEELEEKVFKNERAENLKNAIQKLKLEYQNVIYLADIEELSYKEILKICRWLDFDTSNKVFKGSMDYIQNEYNENNDAVNKIIEIALKNDKTYILGIGAITNIALAIKKEPKIIDKIEVIWLGGNELGNKDNLEYNFRQDVEAVKIVLESQVKLTILPCKNIVSTLRIDINTLKENIGNKSELCDYLIKRFYNDGYHGIQESRVIWDISVIAYMINKNWFETKEISSPNIKEDTSYEMTQNKHNVTFVTKLNRDKIYEDLFNKLGARNEV